MNTPKAFSLGRRWAAKGGSDVGEIPTSVSLFG